MEYQKLKIEITEIGEISASVPEPFREKCFEVLLNHLLAGQSTGEAGFQGGGSDSSDNEDNADNSGAGVEGNDLVLPSQIKAFLRKKGLTTDQLAKLVMIEGTEFFFLKEPSHGLASKGQVEWALLAALKNGILNNSMKADPEVVRSIVQDKGYYDSTNFAANFKKDQCASLFKGKLERQGAAQALSTAGEDKLAELIVALIGS